MTLPPAPAGISYATIGAASALLAILGLLGGVVWSQATQAGQVAANRTGIEKLECLPVQVARVEAALEAQGKQLDRIEDGLKRGKEE